MSNHNCSKLVRNPLGGGYPFLGRGSEMALCSRRGTIEDGGQWWCWQHDPCKERNRKRKAVLKKRADEIKKGEQKLHK